MTSLEICFRCLKYRMTENLSGEGNCSCGEVLSCYDHASDLRILHADMDAFFASVEIHDNPDLKGKPVIVGGDPKSRGVVSTCSYEARAFGVRSAMPLSKAYSLCPSGIFLPVRMQRYAEVSREVFKIFESFTPEYEPLSIDEAFLDMKGTEALFGHPVSAAVKLKQKVREKTGITVSVGVSYNKFLAKLASGENKPDGLFVVTPDSTPAYLDRLSIDNMWGVGKATLPVMKGNMIFTIGDLRRCPEEKLKRIFGNQWQKFYNLSRGIDDRSVETEYEAQSIGKETTLDKDISDREEMKRILWELCEKVSRRLYDEGVRGRTVTLKIKNAQFKLMTRSHKTDKPVYLDLDIFTIIRELLDHLDLKGQKIRLLGVTVSYFEQEESKELFLFEDKKEIRKEKLSEAINKIKDRFGDSVITRAIK